MVQELDSVLHILKIVEIEKIPLILGESIEKNADIFDRENVFIENDLIEIITKFPKLKF